ncbi:dentin sialophosphoprotein [Spatholobus suberectus]|nr:dentin sialophosphoprotein [Spatholobus suberectus]
MDFYALSRKQLQTLCKKNKIPANITNVAMADALAALNQVEGLDEFLNPTDGDAGTPSVHHRTAGRASTQRKGAREEAEGSKVKVSTRPQRGARAAEGVVEQENKDANVPVTPAAASRRRATAVSTRRKKEVEMVVQDADNKNEVQGKPKPADVPKTPAVAPVSRTRATGRSVCTTKIETPAGTSAQRAYSTRRSVRLLEKDLSKMSLMDTDDTGLVKIHDFSQELSNVSQQIEDSADTEKGASLRTVSTVVSEDTQELEVCSSENNTEYECQSHDSGSDVKLVSVTENVMVVEPHGSKEDEQEKVNCLELEAEPHGSDEAGSELLPVLEESCDSFDLEIENKECFGAKQDNLPVEASEDATPEVTDQDIAAVSVVVSDDVSVDVTDQDVGGSFPMLAECNMDDQVSNEGDDKEDKNNVPAEEAELHDSNLILEGSYDTCDKSNDAGSEVLPVLKESCDSSELEIENKESIGVMQDILPFEASEDTATLTVVVPDDVSDQDVAGSLPVSSVNDAPASLKEFVECNQDTDQDILLLEASEDALTEVTGQDTATLTVVVPDDVSDQEVAGWLPMSPVNDAPVNIKEFVECNIDDDQGNYMADEYYQHPLNIDEKAADESELMTDSEGILELESISHSAGEHQEELEAKPERLEAETEKIDDAPDVTGTCAILAVQKDASCEKSGAVIEVCTESSANGKESMGVKNVTIESSLPDVEAEDHKNTSENLEAEAQAAESEEPVAGEDIVLKADNGFSNVLHNTYENTSAGEDVVPQQVTVESAGSSCKFNSPVDGDVVSEDTAIPNQEPRVSSETMTEDSIHEQKSTDIPVQSVVSDQLKENVTSDELHNKSMGELKRMLKKLKLDDKSKTNVVKEVEKKRTALQVLPQNRMTAGEVQIDG